MDKFQRFLHFIVICAFLSACGGNSGLWGAPPTPTLVNAQLPDGPLQGPPAMTLVASPTPLKILPVPGSPTPGPAPTYPVQPTLPPVNTAGPMEVYPSQGGDTLEIVAKRFGVGVETIIAQTILPAPGQLLPAETLLLIPKTDPETPRTPRERTLPDSAFVYGPSSVGFNVVDYVNAQNGYLATYDEYIMSGGTTTGAEAVERIARENSINPRLILAVIEYESKWVRGQPTNLAQDEYPLGYVDYHFRRLFKQLMWASGTLSDGYYRWRSGNLTELTFKDGSSLRMNPHLNAGTAAIQYYFAQNHSRAEWEQAVAPTGFPALYTEMFGPPWERAAAFEPVLTDGLAQPELSLPFEPGKVWAFSGGPHSAWEEKGAMAALDFAPGALESGCVKTDTWVLAPAGGVVARVDTGVVILDLDGDGLEQTGWVLLFLHIRSDGKAKLYQYLQKDDHIGHASCEGGVSTGTHLHFARKYNGEWILADGPLPFTLDGWVAANGEAKYKGSLTKGETVIQANTSGSFETRIIRDKE